MIRTRSQFDGTSDVARSHASSQTCAEDSLFDETGFEEPKHGVGGCGGGVAAGVPSAYHLLVVAPVVVPAW